MVRALEDSHHNLKNQTSERYPIQHVFRCTKANLLFAASCLGACFVPSSWTGTLAEAEPFSRGGSSSMLGKQVEILVSSVSKTSEGGFISSDLILADRLLKHCLLRIEMSLWTFFCKPQFGKKVELDFKIKPWTWYW